MTNINYSFIIPHKNSPQLLNRCVNSIPRRDDVEIIILDDNSDNDIVNWNVFEFENSKCIKVITNDSPHGQGFLRNEGIKIAHGKWILFPDADDYFEKGFLEILDNYMSSEVDIVYFNYNIIRDGFVIYNSNKYVTCYDGSIDSENLVKYGVNSAWTKMVKKSHILKYNAVFDDISVGEDALFTYIIGYFAQRINVCPKPLYNYIQSRNSITVNGMTISKVTQMLDNIKKCNAFADYINLPQIHKSMFKYCLINLWLKRYRVFFMIIRICLVNRSIGKDSHMYINAINARKDFV